MAVVVGPSSYDRIQPTNKKMSGSTQVLPDDLLHFGENRGNTFPSGLDEQLPVRIAPNVLPEEVETFFYVRD